MAKRVANPFPVFFDTDASPLHGGSIYVGEAGKDPQLFPVATFFDSAMTIAAPQPIQTLGGVIMNGANPAHIYVEDEDYSIRARNASGAEVMFLARTLVAGVQYQPLDSDLTAIAELATTGFGRNLLTLANAAALKAATGMPDALPLAGGAVTGTISRSGSGAHTFWVDPGMANGGMYYTGADAADPTTQPGQMWFKKRP